MPRSTFHRNVQQYHSEYVVPRRKPSYCRYCMQWDPVSTEVAASDHHVLATVGCCRVQAHPADRGEERRIRALLPHPQPLHETEPKTSHQIRTNFQADVGLLDFVEMHSLHLPASDAAKDAFSADCASSGIATFTFWVCSKTEPRTYAVDRHFGCVASATEQKSHEYNIDACTKGFNGLALAAREEVLCTREVNAK